MALSPHLVLILFLFFPSPNQVLAQTINGKVNLGSSLFAAENSSPWLSQNGEFAFGFHQLKNQDDIFFLLCIWYAKIPEKTIIWCANGDKPAAARSNVVLTPETGLVLTTPQGKELWKSESIDETVVNGVISNEGNFVLEGNNSKKVWESFKNPTDTILPSQVLDIGQVLSSHQSESNFSRGRFQFRLREDGNVVLNTINLPSNYTNEPYYATNITKGTATTQVVFNESGYLYVSIGKGERLILTRGRVVSTMDYYVRATLSFDGVFTQYFHPKKFSSNVSWTPLWSIPNDICFSTVVWEGIGVCGYNTICRLNKEKRPKCECLKGYSLINPNDSYGNCKPDFIQGCKEDELTSSGKDAYDVVELRNAGWPGSDYIRIASSTRETCKESCLNDCLCAVAVLRGGTCWKKRFPLSNGRVDHNRPSIAFIKIRKGNSTTLSNDHVTKVVKKNQSGLIRVLLGMLSTSVCVNFMLLGAICTCFFFIHKKKNERSHPPQEVPESNLHCFSYKELEEATNGFKDELGRGAFGIVYKGFLIQTNASIAVAVKRLRNVDMGIGEDGKEILTDWAYDCFREGSLDVLVDYEADVLGDKKRLELYVMVSMWCVQEIPSLRPNMRRVVQMLEGVVEVSDPPCPSPSYYLV
ncbi:hypothetical protein CsatB_030831 [Cannabis sativa]